MTYRLLLYLGTAVLFVEIGGMGAIGSALFDRSWESESRRVWEDWLREEFQ